MNIENAVRTLTDLSTVDDALADADPPEGERQIELKDRRADLRGKIPEIVLTTYDALSRARRRPVVVAVRSAHCGGCHLRIPPQLDSAIRRRDSLSVCPHCRRLLYPAPPPSEQQAGNEPPEAALPVRLRVSTDRSAARKRAMSRRTLTGQAPKRGSQARGIRVTPGKRGSAAAARRSATFALELALRPR